MKIKKGATRLVFLFENYVVKVGKVRPLRTFSKIVSIAFSAEKRVTLIEEYGPGLMRALWNFMFVGVWANMNELKYSATGDPRVAKTLRVFCFGFISVQEKGSEVSHEMLIGKYPFSMELVDVFKSDLKEAEQYALFPDGKVKLVDYGNSKTCAVIAQTHH